MQIIPWRNASSFRETVALDGRNYVIWAKWNSTYEFWTIDIRDQVFEPIIHGLKLVPGVELIRRYSNEKLPPGSLMAVDFSQDLERIGRSDMGREAGLVYFPV